MKGKHTGILISMPIPMPDAPFPILSPFPYQMNKLCDKFGKDRQYYKMYAIQNLNFTNTESHFVDVVLSMYMILWIKNNNSSLRRVWFPVQQRKSSSVCCRTPVCPHRRQTPWSREWYSIFPNWYRVGETSTHQRQLAALWNVQQ
jgi:hypothetical protein